MLGPHLLTLLTVLAANCLLAAAGTFKSHQSSTQETCSSEQALSVVDCPVTFRDATGQDTGQDPKNHGAKVRSTYILKIAPYITIKKAKPDSQPFVIAVVGHDSFADAITQLLPGKEITKRKVKIVIIDATVAATTTKHDYDLLYVATSIDALLVDGIISSHKNTATPLFSARPGFATKGGGVQLFIKDNNIKFEVNQSALKEQGLHVSPQLMKLSTKGPEA